MGENELEQNSIVTTVGISSHPVQKAVDEMMCVRTPGGRIQVRWDEGGSATSSASSNIVVSLSVKSG
jgi:hypothetical protein